MDFLIDEEVEKNFIEREYVSERIAKIEVREESNKLLQGMHTIGQLIHNGRKGQIL